LLQIVRCFMLAIPLNDALMHSMILQSEEQVL
jgi:hypothetical protein